MALSHCCVDYDCNAHGMHKFEDGQRCRQRADHRFGNGSNHASAGALFLSRTRRSGWLCPRGQFTDARSARKHLQSGRNARRLPRGNNCLRHLHLSIARRPGRDRHVRSQEAQRHRLRVNDQIHAHQHHLHGLQHRAAAHDHRIRLCAPLRLLRSDTITQPGTTVPSLRPIRTLRSTAVRLPPPPPTPA